MIPQHMTMVEMYKLAGTRCIKARDGMMEHIAVCQPRPSRLTRWRLTSKVDGSTGEGVFLALEVEIRSESQYGG
jgi:hypothetical protein